MKKKWIFTALCNQIKQVNLYTLQQQLDSKLIDQAQFDWEIDNYPERYIVTAINVSVEEIHQINEVVSELRKEWLLRPSVSAGDIETLFGVSIDSSLLGNLE